MNTSLIKVEWTEACRQYRLYRELPEKHQTAETRALRRAYWHAKQGKPIIDLYAAFKEAGVNSDDDPRLAFARATAHTAEFYRRSNGSGDFCSAGMADFRLPENTFSSLSGASWKHLKTQVPMIPGPIQARIKGNLSRFYILWEVEKWDAIPVDPYLLLKLSKNLFVVMAEWNLTPLEQAIVHGRS